jgi:poly(3-hydroxybutyrate) depolymerase
MSSDDSDPRTDRRAGVSRRTFAKAAGVSALVGAATGAGAEAPDGMPADATADADLAAINAAFTPEEWLTAGPFQYQRRDVAVDPSFPLGGADDVSGGDPVPGASTPLPSAFAGGATVEWSATTASGSTVGFPDAAAEIDPTGGDLTPLTNLGGGAGGLFDDFQDWYGIGGSLYGTGLAFTTFEVDGPKRAVLESNATVWLNGRRHEETPTGVVLRDGTNYLLASTLLIFGVSGAVNLRFRPPRAPVETNGPAPFRGIPQDAVVPDLEVGERTDLPASVRVTNTTARRVEDATVTFAANTPYLETREVTVDPPLAPFETRRVNTRVRTVDPDGGGGGAGTQGEGDGAGGGGPPGDLPGSAREDAGRRTDRSAVPARAMARTGPERPVARDGPSATDADGHEFVYDEPVLEVTYEASVDGAADAESVGLRVAPAGANRLMTTFASDVDESVQYFTYRRPSNLGESEGPYDVVFSLHGANVNSWNQAGANNPREDAYVIAPDARGPVNYDHEDLGRVDDLEALDVAFQRFDLDERRVYISGHSMGGHGTWHIGLTNSDRFAAAAPSAGWTDHETYITTTWGRDKLHTYPELKSVKERALQKNLAMPKTANAADGTLPTFVLHGGQDTSVPTLQPRSYVRALANAGLDVDGQVGRRHRVTPEDTDVAYLEVPGQGHFWDAGIGPGTDTVNHPDLFGFLRAVDNDPYPEELTFFTTNLRVEDGKYWVRVLEQEQVHAPTRVEASATGDGVELRTENVVRLELDTAVFEETGAPRRVQTPAGGTRLPGRDGPVVVEFGPGGVRARPSTPGDRGRGRPRKDADTYGPLKEVHQEPYRLVYGTQGDAATTALTRNLANIRSGRLVDRARAPAAVLPDTAVDAETVENYNLVLFGRPSDNAAYAAVADDLPLDVGDGRVRVGDETYRGDLAASFLYPNPRNPDRLVQVDTGTSLSGLALTRVRDWSPTQVGTADYMVYDETVRYRKWDACRAAGFFDKEWAFDDALGFRRSTTEG